MELSIIEESKSDMKSSAFKESAQKTLQSSQQMPTAQTELRKATAYIRKTSASAAAVEAFSPASESRTHDLRLIQSEEVSDSAAVESVDRSPGGSSQFTAQTRLGTSAIKHINLN